MCVNTQSRARLRRCGSPGAKSASSKSHAGAGILQAAGVQVSTAGAHARAAVAAATAGAPRNANKAPRLAIRSTNGASDGQSGGWFESLVTVLHCQAPAARRAAATHARCWLPHPHCWPVPNLGCWVDGGGSGMVDGHHCHGDEEAVRGGEVSEHAARGGAEVQRLQRRWSQSEPQPRKGWRPWRTW